MIQAPTNNIIVSVATKYIQSVGAISKLSAIQNATSVGMEDLVQIVGKIESLPKMISPHNEYKGYSTKDMKVGDTILFSYQVIHDMKVVDGQEGLEFANSFVHDGKEYFLCNIRHAFAVIRGEDIIMVNGYVMLSACEEKKIIIPHSAKRTVMAAFSEVLEIGHSRTHLSPINAKKGDTVFFDEKKAQKYELNHKKFLIIPQDKILGSKKE